MLAIGHWVNLLAQLNKEFDEMYVIRANTSLKPGQIDQKRRDMRSAYDEIVQDTISFSRVATDKTPYYAIIDEMNGLINNYNTSVTLRLASRNTESNDVDILRGMDRADILRLAKRQLGLTYPGFAVALGVSPRTMAKWALGPGSGDRGELPLMPRRFAAPLLDAARRRHLSAGDRAAVERIDALAAQADPARLRESLRSLDALQRSANAFVPMTVRRRPAHFRTMKAKNEWEEQEALADARRARAKSARGR